MTNTYLKSVCVISLLGAALAVVGFAFSLAAHHGAQSAAELIPYLIAKNDRTLEFVEPQIIDGPHKKAVLEIIQAPINERAAIGTGWLSFVEVQKEQTFGLCLLWAGTFIAFLCVIASIARAQTSSPK